MLVKSVNIFRLAEMHWAVQICVKTVEARRVFDLVGEKMFVRSEEVKWNKALRKYENIFCDMCNHLTLKNVKNIWDLLTQIIHDLPCIYFWETFAKSVVALYITDQYLHLHYITCYWKKHFYYSDFLKATTHYTTLINNIVLDPISLIVKKHH